MRGGARDRMNLNFEFFALFAASRLNICLNARLTVLMGTCERSIVGGMATVVLIGYRGSGKTTVGRLLAARMDRTFVDCDEVIVARHGKSIREIFAGGGEEAFRRLETAAIAELSRKSDHIIAVGGGAILAKANRDALANHFIVYLRAEAATLLRRIQSDAGSSDNRPNLTSLGGGIEEIEALLTQREPIYRSAMNAELDVTELSPQQAAERIAEMIPRVSKPTR
jgi:shikimate kinase